LKAGKVWGVTEALLQNPVVEFHRIEVNKGGECSTHKHAHKWNGFFVEEGELENTIAFEIYWPELLSEDIQRKSVGKMNA
jgi:mannose-6-phosphate isomerase-like protein (cupin superfamily)